MRLVIRWIINAIALVVAAYLVPGITVTGENAYVAFAVTAIVLGLLNATLKPILTFLTCGFVLLTLGFGLLFINAAVLMAASWISQNLFGAGFVVDGFWSAFFGGIVISVVSFLLTMFADDEADTGRSKLGARRA
ncbi:MAG: phage holin family protein [Actinomycetota bacterium]|nr:phage holin family protein [Actinomycetota bacterium]MDZ4177933.1 phage holin family protein [Coriobacteriia bacterium]